MPVDEQHICEGCGLEFDENELDAEGLCKDCAKDFGDVDDDLEDDIEDAVEEDDVDVDS